MDIQQYLPILDVLGKTADFFLVNAWQILSAGVALACFISLYQLHLSNKNQLNMADLFLDSNTNRISGSKFRLNIAFLVATWVLVWLTVKDKLTEWYITAYLGAFVLDRFASRNSSADITKAKTTP